MRIVGGTLGGRGLKSVPGPHTRPSSERLREGLMSALLARDAVGARSVLDLYAGSGALGLEALSRGAASVVAVDNAPRALRCIAQNARTLGVGDHVTALRADLERPSELRKLATAAQAPFDLVLCDPPYAAAAGAGELLERLAAAGALHAEAWAALEHDPDAPPSAALSFEEVAHYRYGGSAVALWRRIA